MAPSDSYLITEGTMTNIVERLEKIIPYWPSHEAECRDAITKIESDAKEIAALREALENARRDMFGFCPKSDTGSNRKKLITAAIERVEIILRSNEQNVGKSK
jgi:hypothetical protein